MHPYGQQQQHVIHALVTCRLRASRAPSAYRPSAHAHTPRAVYARAKGFVCCEALDVFGGTWLGLIIVGTSGLLLCAATLSFVASLDRLPPKRCGSGA